MLNNEKIGNILFHKIFLGYLFLTLIFTGYFIYAQYSMAKETVIKDMNTIEKSFYRGLANSLWHLDEKQIDANAQAMKSIQGIIGVSIVSVNNEVLSQKGTLELSENSYETFLFEKDPTIKFSQGLIKHTFGIINEEFSPEEVLANVTLYTSKNAIYSIVKKSSISILIYAFILIIVLWILFNYFANKLLTTPLNTIIQATENLNMKQHKKIVLNYDNKTELNLLTDTFNDMSKRITDSFKELSYHKDNLENKVKERTIELEEKNKELIESQDITNIARKNAEEANREKSMLLANISHELKTPLNGIFGLIYLTKLKANDSEVVKNLSSIQDYSETLLRMISDLLDSSKIEAKEFKIEKSTFNLIDMLESLKQLYKIQCSDKNLDFELNYDKNIPENLISDPIRLHQVISNLLNNAVKFTHQGKVTLDVIIQSSTTKEVKLEFIVKDDGIGIKEEELKNIFKPFYQTKESLNYFAGGSGLGLNISQRIIEQLDGMIWTDSKIGEGSSFFVLLDFGIAKEEIQAPEYKKETNSKINSNSDKKVLVVDDNKINIDVLNGILNSIGIICDTALNGLDALNLVKQKKYDIVLTDIKMPIMDGWELSKGIRALYDKNELPIIAISANTTEQIKDNLVTCEINDYIQKPINPDSFLQALKNNINCSITQVNLGQTSEVKSNSILDKQEALKRFVNNKELYVQALNSFIMDYEHSLVKIKKFIEDKNLNELIDYLHAIKGISANLSAKEFNQIVVELHDSIKYGKAYATLLQDYETSFKELKKEISQYVTHQKVKTDENENLLNNKEEILNILLEYCKSHNTKAVRFFNEISYEVRQDPFITELQRDISNYNFKIAQEKIEKKIS